MEKLGQGALQASRFFGQVVASNANNELMQGVSKILYGDPNKTTIGPDGKPAPDLGYLGTRGRSALDQRQNAEQQLEDLRNQLRGNLPTPESQLEFDDFSRRFLTYKSGEIGSHADMQANAWYGEVEKASADNAIAGIRQNPTDPAQVDHYTAMLMQSRLRTISRTIGNAQGPETNEIVNDALSQSRADAAEARIDALIPTNPAAAQQILQSPAGQLLKGPRYDALSAKLQTTTDQAAAHALVFGGSGVNLQPTTGGGQNNPGNIRVPGSTGTSATAFQSFPTLEAGIAAIGHQLDNYQARGITTLGRMVATYSPPTENPTATLIQRASAMTGIAPDAPVDLHDPATRTKVVTAFLANEHGGQLPANISQIQVAQAAGTSAATLAANAPPEQTPGLSDKIREIENAPGVSDRAKADAVELATRVYSAQWADQTRAYELHERQVKVASDSRENEIIADSLSTQPRITAQQVANDPALTPDARLRMIGVLRAQAPNDKADQIYGPGFWTAYRDITAPPGDPNRITDQATIIRRAGPGGDLTLAGVKELNQTLASMKKPEAAGDQKMQAGALAYAKHQLSDAADYGTFKVRDPKGEDAFNIGFIPAFFKYWQDGIAAGKSPSELVEKKNIDALIQPYLRTPAERMRDRLAEGIGAPTAASPGPDLTTQAGIIAAYRAGQIGYAQASQALIGGGFAAPAGPTVPIAH